MEQVLGMGNWTIQYRETESGITVLRAVTKDSRAVLPQAIHGLPVRELSDYSLSVRDKVQPAEDIKSIEITDGRAPQDAEWDNRQIRELRLPESLRKVGSYCFMGLRNLEKLEFHDEEMEWGISPFMNCIFLHDIVIHRPGDEKKNLAWLCGEVNGELDVTIRRPGEPDVKVLFPGYTEISEENTPARQFNFSMEGMGYPYHHVFRDRKLDWHAYDGIWERAKARGGDNADTLLQLAWYRIWCPEHLSEERRQDYVAYAERGAGKLLDWILEEGNAAELAELLERVKIPEEDIRRGCDAARAAGKTQCVALLLAKLPGAAEAAPAGRRKTFEL